MSWILDLVLVSPRSPGNIGAAARAVANMGGRRLILVDPGCDPWAEESRMAAAGAKSVLESITVIGSWLDFEVSEPSAFRWALTRRAGKLRNPIPIDLACDRLKVQHAGNSGVLQLILGPERSGLRTDQIEACNLAVSLETFGDFSSLNLAQAALLALYQTQRGLAQKSSTSHEVEVRAGDISKLDPLFKSWLDQIGFDWRKRKSSALKTLMKLVRKSHPNQREIDVLDAIWSKALGRAQIRASSTALFEEPVDDL